MLLDLAVPRHGLRALSSRSSSSTARHACSIPGFLFLFWKWTQYFDRNSLTINELLDSGLRPNQHFVVCDFGSMGRPGVLVLAKCDLPYACKYVARGMASNGLRVVIDRLLFTAALLRLIVSLLRGTCFDEDDILPYQESLLGPFSSLEIHYQMSRIPSHCFPLSCRRFCWLRNFTNFWARWTFIRRAESRVLFATFSMSSRISSISRRVRAASRFA